MLEYSSGRDNGSGTSEYIENEDDTFVYVNAASETDDTAFLQVAIDGIAKAHGMSQIIKRAGVGRNGLHKNLDRDGDPNFHTISRAINALDGRLVIKATTTSVTVPWW